MPSLPVPPLSAWGSSAVKHLVDQECYDQQNEPHRSDNLALRRNNLGDSTPAAEEAADSDACESGAPRTARKQHETDEHQEHSDSRGNESQLGILIVP